MILFFFKIFLFFSLSKSMSAVPDDEVSKFVEQTFCLLEGGDACTVKCVWAHRRHPETKHTWEGVPQVANKSKRTIAMKWKQDAEHVYSFPAQNTIIYDLKIDVDAKKMPFFPPEADDEENEDEEPEDDHQYKFYDPVSWGPFLQPIAVEQLISMLERDLCIHVPRASEAKKRAFNALKQWVYHAVVQECWSEGSYLTLGTVLLENVRAHDFQEQGVRLEDVSSKTNVHNNPRDKFGAVCAGLVQQKAKKVSVTCYLCKKQGHYANKCPSKAEKQDFPTRGSGGKKGSA
jgi:hypothetical protein